MSISILDLCIQSQSDSSLIYLLLCNFYNFYRINLYVIYTVKAMLFYFYITQLISKPNVHEKL